MPVTRHWRSSGRAALRSRSPDRAAPGATIGLLADDLTGALDTAARLVPLGGPLTCLGRLQSGRLPMRFALNSGTRELSDTSPVAAARVRACAAHLAGVDLAFLKIDSLLRGRIVADLRILFELGRFDRCLIAPALPDQGRWTEGGRQHLREAGASRRIGPDLVSELNAREVPAAHLVAGDIPGGAHWAWLADARDLDDLRRHAVAIRQAGGRVLYCGTSGLAQALAGAAPAAVPVRVRAPMLAIVGSFHAVTRAQLTRLAGTDHVHLVTHGPQDAVGRTVANLAAALAAGRNALLSFRFADGTDRITAERTITETVVAMLPSCPRPQSLLVVGGETLAQIVSLLKVDQIRVLGEHRAGVPRAVLVGGHWDGLDLLSKSGAFGAPGLLDDILRGAPR